MYQALFFQSYQIMRLEAKQIDKFAVINVKIRRFMQ